MISTLDLSLLPDIHSLRRLLQSLAMLDAILCPAREFRYYSCDSNWADGQQLGSMRDGSGDHFFAHFSKSGCWLKGFAHESLMSPQGNCSGKVWPGVLNGVPPEFTDCLQEPAFEVEQTTFCLWRRYNDRCWQTGQIAYPGNQPDPDGSAMLLSHLDGRPETYQVWATEYYERPVSLAAIEHVYQQNFLMPDVISELNPKVSLADLGADIAEIGYPCGF